VSELQPLVQELEEVVQRLGQDTLAQHPDWYHARFAEIYDGGVEAFGPLGPDRLQRLGAELWFLLDCPLPDVHSPLWRMLAHHTARAGELLARSELRVWRIATVPDAASVGAECPRTGAPVRLDFVRAPKGEPAPGAFVVARSVPLGPERWALLGPASIVESGAETEFVALLSSLEAPRGEFWRVHGGVLSRASWAWPEWREHTLDGQLVTGSMAALELHDRDAAIAALAADPELQAIEGASLEWQWSWDPPRRRQPLQERGVRYRLCAEDAATVPRLARLDIEADDDRLWLLTPTPARLLLAERLLRDRLGVALGRVATRDFLPPSAIPRWKRESQPLTARGDSRRAAAA
jgi:hypothetical protein